MSSTKEEAKREYDVVVCGAGPAGVAAALAASRSGARTALLENHGCLGGVWTAGGLCWVIDSENKAGIMAELIAHLDARSARATKIEHNQGFAYDVEQMKLLLEELVVAEKIHARLHTTVCGVAQENGTMTGVYTQSKSGRELWKAKAFIDCTGDGDVGALAGCPFDYGHPETGEGQPMSLMALVTGIHANEVAPFIGGGVRGPKRLLAQEMERAGVSPSYSEPILFRIYDDLFALIANHEYGRRGFDADDVTSATIQARVEVNSIVNSLQRKGGVWQNLKLVATAAQIGVREGRRIHGLYTVSKEDLLEGRRHPDAVCRVTFKMDVHHTNPKNGASVDRSLADVATRSYDIPFRAIVAQGIEGLMMAGRCISGDFFAHSSYRVTGNAVRLGQSAGTAAAEAAKRGCAPSKLDWEIVSDALERLDLMCEKNAQAARKAVAS